MPIVKFVKEKKEIDVPDGTDLRSAALQAGVNLYHGFNGCCSSLNRLVNCHGLGGCGTCRVLVAKGMESLSPMGMLEKAKFRIIMPDPPVSWPAVLAFIGHEDTMRLACQSKVHGDVEIETGPDLDLYGENFFS